MEKMWAGRTSGETDRLADDFNSSIRFDRKMYRQDIRGSMEHAFMLEAQGILKPGEGETIRAGLAGILADLESGKLPFDDEAEDIHMFIEAELTRRIGDAGKRLHTARSRNDQVAVDLRLYMRDTVEAIRKQLVRLVDAIGKKAGENTDTIMPGYTHMQRAQPVTFAHHLLAYAMMFMRDDARLEDAVARMNVSPLGACALAGTTYPTDRDLVASRLGFDGICENSMDAVSDRDYCIELEAAFSLIMMHLSRFSEELILWSGWEFRFIELDDAYTTGSSIMPQKKNPDMAELVRGKTGRVYGDLMATLTVFKSLPLAYNKDMQEDKEAIFDAAETVMQCLGIFIPMLSTLRPRKEAMYRAACQGFINATDLADYLTKKGLPFRSAYKIVGTIVADCIAHDQVLETLPLDVYRSYCDLFDEDLYGEISLRNCIAKRISQGSAGPESVRHQLSLVESFVSAHNA